MAEEITSLAEEAHKLVSALRSEDRRVAAIQRSILAVHLAPILAVRRRILHGPKNRLWDFVSDSMGEEWRRIQSISLGLECQPFEETCQAALRLYGLAADEASHLFDGRQEPVVRHARELACPADGRKL